jgi:hypothetical protein
MDIVFAFKARLIFGIIVFVLGIIYCVWMSKRVQFGGEVVLFLALIICIPLGLFIHDLYSLYDMDVAAEYVREHKPDCYDSSDKCMSKRLDWYRDSVMYIVPSDAYKKFHTDSLKHELLKYEGHK